MPKTKAKVNVNSNASKTAEWSQGIRVTRREMLIERIHAKQGVLADHINNRPELKRVAELLLDRYPSDLVWVSTAWTKTYGVLGYRYQPLPLLCSILSIVIRHPTLRSDIADAPDPTPHFLNWYEKARDILKAKMPDFLAEAMSNLYCEVRDELLKELNGEAIVVNEKVQNKLTEERILGRRRGRLRIKPRGPGRPGRFDSKEQFIREVRYALRGARKREEKITQDTILPYFRKAKRVPDSRKLRDYLTKFGLKWKEVKRL